jgi:Skp family chaperone for outer membrane proteins
MKSLVKSPFGLAALVVVAGMLLMSARPAVAADDLGSKIGICNPLKVITQIQEYKDITENLKQESTSLTTEATQRNAKIQSMQDELKLLEVNSPQYKEKNEALLKYSIETDTWSRLAQLQEQRKMKEQTKALFDKMNQAVAQVAKDRGLVMVLSDHPVQIDDADKLDANTFNAALLSATILFSDPKMDITQDVIVAMDKNYNKK